MTVVTAYVERQTAKLWKMPMMLGKDEIVGEACSIVVNGSAVETRAVRLDALLIELGYGDSKVATALNGEFVPSPARSETAISAGDRIEVVAPRQGG